MPGGAGMGPPHEGQLLVQFLWCVLHQPQVNMRG
jgi:hypothetical protein